MHVDARPPSYRFDRRPCQVSVGGMSSLSLRRVIEHIETHLSANVSQRALASIAGLGIDHFCCVFKFETGVTPHGFLIRKRVQRAKELLIGSDFPIAQIANEVGFSGQSHLTYHFRRYTGTTPLRFRRAKKMNVSE